VVTDT